VRNSIIIIISIFSLYFSYAATLLPSAIKYILLIPDVDNWRCTNVCWRAQILKLLNSAIYWDQNYIIKPECRFLFIACLQQKHVSNCASRSRADVVLSQSNTSHTAPSAQPSLRVSHQLHLEGHYFSSRSRSNLFDYVPFPGFPCYSMKIY